MVHFVLYLHNFWKDNNYLFFFSPLKNDCSITSLWLNSAPFLTAHLEQISMQYYISTIKFCGRFGIKAPFLKMRTIWGTDFKYSLIIL